MGRILSQPPERYITFKVIFLLAKYYYSLGLNHKQTKKKVLEYCFSSEYFNLTLREDAINKALTTAKFHALKSSNFAIPITKNEISKLKVLSHSDYRIGLYMLFVAKLEKYQSVKSKNNKVKSFSLYFNYLIKTAYYNVVNEENPNANTITKI